MQRLFSAFPGRGPGAGLLLLRAALGAFLIVQGSLAISIASASPQYLVAFLLVVVGVMLAIGVLTPVAGLGAALVMVLGGLPWLAAPSSSLQDWMGRVFFVIVSLAIALVGPGAFSLDAYLFGRREIVIPR